MSMSNKRRDFFPLRFPAQSCEFRYINFSRTITKNFLNINTEFKVF
jgi:hypothetical protein